MCAILEAHGLNVRIAALPMSVECMMNSRSYPIKLEAAKCLFVDFVDIPVLGGFKYHIKRQLGSNPEHKII
jgi:hypothetical protein